MMNEHQNIQTIVPPKLNCEHCKKEGSVISERHRNPRDCGFDKNGVFSVDNYCCATLLRLRSIAEDKGLVTCCDDENFALFSLGGYHSDIVKEEEIAVLIHWYKSRGRTMAGWILCDWGLPHTPLRADVATELLEVLKQRYLKN